MKHFSIFARKSTFLAEVYVHRKFHMNWGDLLLLYEIISLLGTDNPINSFTTEYLLGCAGINFLIRNKYYSHGDITELWCYTCKTSNCNTSKERGLNSGHDTLCPFTLHSYSILIPDLFHKTCVNASGTKSV